LTERKTRGPAKRRENPYEREGRGKGSRSEVGGNKKETRGISWGRVGGKTGKGGRENNQELGKRQMKHRSKEEKKDGHWCMTGKWEKVKRMVQ